MDSIIERECVVCVFCVVLAAVCGQTTDTCECEASDWWPYLCVHLYVLFMYDICVVSPRLTTPHTHTMNRKTL